jgi:syntaxin 1B/2/3
VPDQYTNGYGGRQDNEAGYYERNASSAALNDDDGYSQKSRSKASLHGYGAQPDTYEIPSLPKSSNNYPSHQQPQFSPSTPRSNGGAGQHASIPPGAQITSNAPQVDMPSFFNEIDEVRDSFRELEQAIVYLDQLHSRNLQGTGSEETQYELEQAADQTRQQTAQLRQRIKALQETTRIRTHGQAEDDRLVRKAQIESLRNKCGVFSRPSVRWRSPLLISFVPDCRFLEIVHSYQNMEMRNRDKAKRGIERQYQIVKPDATPEEIRQVVEGGQEVQVFAQALRQSNRVANARGVLNDVQNRHEDIKKIAQTIMELQRLFEDMATCVSRCGHAVLAREG